MSDSLFRRNAEGLTQNTIANMITPYINPVVTGMVVWVLTKLETVSSWSAGAKIALIIAVAVVLTFLLHTLPILLSRRRNSPDQLSPAPVASESARLIEVRDDLDAMTRNRDTTQRNLEACWAEQKQTLEKLAECESQLKHWKGEVDRVRLDCDERIRVVTDEWKRNAARVSELEQELRVSQEMVNELRRQLSTPNGWVKIKKVRYIAKASNSKYFPSTLLEKDLTEFFEDQFVENGKLVIPPGLYRKLFGPLNDPSRGVPKVLEIRFVHAGNEMSVILPENISITLPFPYAVTPEDMT